MRRNFLLLAALLTAPALGCGRSTVDVPYRFDERPTNVEPPSCPESQLRVEVSYLEPSRLNPWATPAATPSSIVFAHPGTSFGNSPEDLEVFRRALSNGGEEQLTANDVHDFVIDASASSVLLSRSFDEMRSLYLYDGQGETLLSSTYPSGTIPRVIAFDGGAVDLVSETHVAWWEPDRIYVYDGDSVTAVSGDLANNSSPTVTGMNVAWTTGSVQDSQLYLSTPEGVEQITSDAAFDRAPVMTKSHVFWLSDNRLMSRRLDGGAPRLLREGPCAPPAADDERAVFTCGAPESPIFPTPGEALFVADGENIREITSATGFIYAPRISGGLIAWLQYESADSLCSAPEGAPGRLFLASLDRPEDAIEVAQVGLPCLCCGAYWAPPSVDLRGDVLVWNYGLPDGGGEPGRAFSSGVAAIWEDCIHDPHDP